MFLEADVIAQFRDAMSAAGIHYGDRHNIAADGELHRFHVEGDHGGKQNGWYILHYDAYPAGWFGCNKRLGHEQRIEWTYEGGAQPLTPEQRREMQASIERKRLASAEAEKKRHAAAAALATRMWEAAKPATTHPYLKRKKVEGLEGLRVGTWIKQWDDKDSGELREGTFPNALLIRMRDENNDTHSLQAIFPKPIKWAGSERDKDFVRGGRKLGLWASIGKPREIDGVLTVGLGEGYATCAAVHLATNGELAMLVCFDAGNLIHVARTLRKLIPHVRILLCADNDQWTLEPIRNPGLTKAAAAAAEVGGLVVAPVFANRETKPSDWNDLLALEGATEVLRQVTAALAAPDAAAEPPVPGGPPPEDSYEACGNSEGEGEHLDDDGNAAKPACDSNKIMGWLREDWYLERLGSVRPQAIPFSEDVAAQLFADCFDGSLAFHGGDKGWYVFTGSLWRCLGKEQSLQIVRKFTRHLSGHLTDRDRISLQRISFLRGVETLARGDGRLLRSPSFWDRNRLLLGAPAGAINLTNGSTLSDTSGWGITKCTAVSASDNADCPRWLSFLQDLCGGDGDFEGFIKRYLGSCLTGLTTDQALLFLVGDGGNGKGVLVDTVRWILGSYAINMPIDALMQARGERHTTDLAMLQGARVVTASEADEGSTWAEARLKMLTGGDPITARKMRQDNITFEPEFKLIIQGNHLPHLRTVDHAIKRRLKIALLDRRPPRIDVNLRSKLRAEAPSILRWMIDGAQTWRAEGLGTCPVIEQSVSSYLAYQDTMGDWLAEECEELDDGRATVAALYESYAQFLRLNGEISSSKKAFSMKLASRGFAPQRTAKARYIPGLCLRRAMTDDASDRSY